MNKTDRRILAAAMLMLAMMLYLLYDDSLILPSDDSSNLTPIGKISQIDRDVRRKVSKKFVWRSARTKDTVHVGDSVFTGEESSVHVELKDGRTLTLQENSMIVFNTSGDQLNLDLRFGTLQGKLDGCVKINIKGVDKEICGKDSPIEVNSDGTVQVKVDTEPKENIQWVRTPQKQFLHFKNSTPLKVSWKGGKQFSRYRVQLSRQADFETIAYEEKTQKQEITTRGYPPTGTFFIRVQGDNIKGRLTGFSKTEKFDIQEIEAPLITAPVHTQKLTFKTNPDGDLLEKNQVQIQWQYFLQNARFEVEIARDDQFSQIVERHPKLSHTALLSKPLTPGQYFVRVRDMAKTDDQPRPWSSVVQFEIDYQQPAKIPAPQLLTKTIDYHAPQPEDLKIQWTAVEEAQQYVVEVSPTEDFSSKSTFKTVQPELKIKSLEAGKAYFRVFSSTKKGTLSDSSELGTWSVKMKRPVLRPLTPIVVQGKSSEDEGDPQAIQATWSDLKYAPSYEVQVSTDPQFKNKVRSIASAPTSKVELPRPGEYYMRVRGINKHGNPITRFSDVEKVNYTLRVPLATPVVLEPFDQATLFFQKNASPFVWLEWKQVRQAAKYHIEVALDEDFQNKVLDATTSSRRYLIRESLPATNLYWRVQAEGDDGRLSGWTSTRTMSIYSGRAPAGRSPASRRR